MKKVMLVIMLVMPLLMLASCKPSEEKPIDIWLKINPVQCGKNPWQQSWLESSRDKFQDDKSLNDAFKDVAEIELIQSFYKSQGIAINSLRFRRTMTVVCGSCACPRGDALFVLVDVDDAGKMKNLGFQDITSDDKRIILIPNERYCLDDSDCAWTISNCCEGGRAFWSCYSKETAFECPQETKCAINKKPARSCGCLENICEAV